MIPEPVYYEVGNALEDGHTHLFTLAGGFTETAASKDEDEINYHTHGIGVVGDLIYCSVAKGDNSPHTHYQVRMVRPIE